MGDQERAVGLLRHDVESGRIAHAYLLVGSAGGAPTRAAMALAAALVCETAGCGTCESCRRVARHAHPDVEVVEPAGMQLLVDQVRDATRTAWRRPTAGSRRVVVVDQADRMNPNAQNAFLKALEEPPASTVLVLVAGGAEALLPTVRSRCREVTFAPPSEEQIARTLAAEGIADAARWARVAGTLERARRLATDDDAVEMRRDIVRRVLEPSRDPGDALAAAEWLADRGRRVRDSVAEAQRAEQQAHADWYAETRRQADERTRREQRRAEQDALESALDDVTSVLRDLLATTQSPDAPLVNDDLRDKVAARAASLGPDAVPAIIASLGVVEDTRRRLRANANVLLALESLFLVLFERLG